MARVREQFAAALRRRLSGRLPAGLDAAVLASPAAARGAGLPAEAIARAAAQVLEAPYAVSLAGRAVCPTFLRAVPIGFARRHGVVALAGGNGALEVAVSAPEQLGQLGALGRLLDKPVAPLFAPAEEIARAINAAYESQTGQAHRLIETFDRSAVLAEAERAAGNEDLLDVAARAPVIRLVNLVLFEAVQQRASDVHVQPYEDRLIVRLRVDGVLHDVHVLPGSLQP